MTPAKMALILLVSITEGDERPGACTQKKDRTQRERNRRCHRRQSNASHSGANQSLYLIFITQLQTGGRALTVQNCDSNAMTSNCITARCSQRSQNQYVSQAVHHINSTGSEQQSRYFQEARLPCYHFHVPIFTICHQIVFPDPIRVTKNVNLAVKFASKRI